MINFRFHIISIVAIFLALGIGIVMGSTVIDRAIVDGLRSRIDVAESNSVKRKDENDRLQKAVEQQDQQDTILASHSVRDYLKDQSVYVIVLGDVSDDLSTELVELGSVSGAQINSMFTFKDDFIEKDKSKLFQELMNAANVDESKIDSSQRLQTILNYFENSLNVVRDKNENAIEGEIDYQAFIDLLASKSVYGESNTFQNPKEKQAVSFIVLIDRDKLENKNYVTFATHLMNNFPVTFGLVGDAKEGDFSRSDAVNALKEGEEKIAIVDNAETPSGRAALLIAHSQNIGGKQDIYGISSAAKSKAPFIE